MVRGLPQGGTQDWPMSRRTFGRMVAVLLVAAPRMAVAQGSTVVRCIGVLESNAPERATTTIQIVFRAAGDAVLLGLVANLARPGGNVTGYSQAGPEVTAKYLSLLKELLAGTQRIGVIEFSPNPYFRAARGQFEHTCRSLGLEPIVVQIAAAGEIAGAIAQLVRQRAQALVLRGDGFFYDHRFEIVNAAMKHGLPTLVEDGDIVRQQSQDRMGARAHSAAASAVAR